VTATLRAALAIALLAGLCLIPVALVFSVLFFLAFFAYIIGGSQHPFTTPFYVILFGILGMWSLLYTVFLLYGVTGRPRDASAVISRAQAPALWHRVDRLARRTGTRPPAELRLTGQANAGVVEETRWLGLIPVTRRMYVGIPLLLALPPAQLDAVLCHEFGHYARGHTRVGAVCYRARTAAELMVRGLGIVQARSVRRTLVSRVHFRLILGYTGLYRRLSAAATQNQEFEADAQAARITGPRTTADALCAVHAVGAAWHEFTSLEKDLSALRGDTKGRFAEFRDRWVDPEVRREAARTAAGQVHDPFSTHPPLAERLARISPERVPPELFSSWPAPGGPPAAAPDMPLDADELRRLFDDEATSRGQRTTATVAVPLNTGRQGFRAIPGILLRALKAHPAAAVLAAAVVLGGAAAGGYEGHQHASRYGAFVSMPDSMELPSASPVASQLTDSLQSRNESRFLRLAAPAARKAMRSWWAAQQTMGFTTGAVVPVSDTGNSVHVDSAGNGTATVLAGTHNPYDPAGGVLRTPPAVPSAEYRIGLHFPSGAGPETVGQITSWTPLNDTPWDQGTPLTVRRAAHVEVVGGPGDAALVSQTLPLAETAAVYDLAFISRVDPSPVNDQTGFVVFVSGSAADRSRWFRSGPQPEEQTGDPDGGTTHLLQGPADGYTLFMSTNASFFFADGGARIVITPYRQAGETPSEETGVLAREMMHARLMSFHPPDKAVQPWANEGIGRAIASLYQADRNPVSAPRDLRPLISAVRALPGAYRTGALPGARQLYGGTAASRADWDTVAASVYAYIAEKYGVSDMLGSADELGTTIARPGAPSGPDTPFDHVYQPGTTGKISYYPASTISSGWQKWLKNPR
jgi:Zn-dependent protease with chaperone function